MISIRSDISEKLNVPFGPKLIGKVPVWMPWRDPTFKKRIQSGTVIRKLRGDFAVDSSGDSWRRSAYAGSRNGLAFFKYYDDMIGQNLFVDGRPEGKIQSIDKGIFVTDNGSQFNAENYCRDDLGEIVSIKSAES